MLRLTARINRFIQSRSHSTRHWTLGAILAVVSVCTFAGPSVLGWNLAQAREHSVRPVNAPKAISVRQLPREAQHTLVLIRQGGPFPYAKDGIVFGNYEKLLPQRRRGYYHEYTVQTPRSRDRGARRIICGGPKRTPDLCYYTHDHYASFQPIAQ